MTQKEEETLFKNNLKLVYKIVNKFNDYTEDYIEEGKIGLWNAIRTFDSTKGYKFSTYAYTCIHNEICLYIRNHVNHKPEIIEDEETNDKYLNELLTSKDDYIEDQLMIEDFISKLPEKERDILNLLLEGYTQTEIGQKIGLCRASINRTCNMIRIRYNYYRNGKDYF